MHRFQTVVHICPRLWQCRGLLVAEQREQSFIRNLSSRFALFLSESCNYLLVYEYVITDDFEKDTWAGMKRAIVTRSIHDQSSGDASVNRTLLLGGRKDGCICVFNWETGAIDFKIEVTFVWKIKILTQQIVLYGNICKKYLVKKSVTF